MIGLSIAINLTNLCVAEAGAGARPGGAEAVEVGATVGVGQHSVRLVDFLEALLGAFVPGVAIGVILV